LLKGAEVVVVMLSPQVGESDCFGHFVAAVVKLQQFVISVPSEVHHRNWAAIHQMSAPVEASPCLYSRHIMTSALHHTVRFVKIF